MLRDVLKQNQFIEYVYICARNLISCERRQMLIDSYRNDKLTMMGEKNPDKVILMIDASNSYTSGFFSNLSSILLKCAYAHDRGMVPVIYRKTPSHYNEPERYLGTDNYFEYFFRQPAEIKISDAMESKHVVWQAGKHMREYYHMERHQQDRVYVEEIRRCLKFKDMIRDELEDSRKVFLGDRKVLGVKYRGTGYKYRHKGHPVYVSIDDIMEHTEAIYDKGYDYIYLATEDKSALDVFKKRFGNELVYDGNILRADEGQLHIDLATSDPKHHTAYLEGLNVLKDVWVLSHASSFVGSQCGVTKFVYLFNEAFSQKQFENLDIIDKGVYKRGVNSIKEGIKKYGIQ